MIYLERKRLYSGNSSVKCEVLSTYDVMAFCALLVDMHDDDDIWVFVPSPIRHRR